MVAQVVSSMVIFALSIVGTGLWFIRQEFKIPVETSQGYVPRHGW